MTNRLAVFIHGLGGDAVTTWAQFPNLLRSDNDITGRYTNIVSFEYATAKAGPTRPLSEIAFELANFVAAKTSEFQIDEITFIAHSQGGLLAYRYLCDVLDGQRSPNAPMPIFRLLTFATPHWGSYPKQLARFIPEEWKQQNDLAFDSDAIHAVNSDWARTDAENRINVQHVIAGGDALVPLFSTLGANYNNDYRVVPEYGHTDVVKVSDASHPSFQIAKTFLLTPTSHQPALSNPDKTPPVLSALWYDNDEIQGTSRFIYTSRYIPFLGREREKSQITAFLHSPAKENVAWMWIKGQGGVGKSRLALELCLAWQADWHAGFLDRDANAPDWTRWQPLLPTLLVIDYATADIDKLGGLLRGLCNRDEQRRLRRPVRVLLLDRHQQEDKLEQAIGEGAGAVNIKDCRQPDLDLITIDDPWAIIEHFMTRANTPMPDKAQTLARLNLVDPARRPLFAMLLADALTQVGIDSITRESLLDNVLKRERKKFWLPAATECEFALAKAERLLAFATMINGLALNKVQNPIQEWDPDEATSVFEIMSGYDRDSDTIVPLAPDLLGECFVLQQFNTMPQGKTHDTLTLAWNQWPNNTFEFFDRITQDFPSDIMLDKALDVSPVNREGRTAWSMWVVNLIGRTAIQHPARAIRAGKILTTLADAHSEMDIRILQAKATYNLCFCLINSDPASARVALDNLCALATAHPHEEIRLMQAKAADNLVFSLTDSDPAAAQAVFDNLCSLADDHPDEPEIRFCQAKAAANLICGLAASDDPAAALVVFTNLCSLVNDHPGEPEIRLEQARAVVNLIGGLATFDPVAALEIFKSLYSFADAHPSELEIRLLQAKAAHNLCLCLAKSDPVAAQTVFESLCTLADNHPDKEIRQLQAKTTAILVEYLTKSDPVTAQTIFERLCTLADAHPDEPDIRLVQAHTALYLIIDLAESDPVAAQVIFENWCALATDHLHQEIRLLQAQAALYLISLLANQKPIIAQAVFKNLCVLADASSDVPEILLIQAKAANDLIYALAFHDQASAQTVFNILCVLATAHPHEEIILIQAKAANNLIFDLATSDPVAAQAVFENWCALAKAHPHKEIRFLQAQAAGNLISILANFKPMIAQAVFKNLCALADAHPNEPEIRLIQAQAADDLGGQ